MGDEIYEIVALAARYWFLLLMVLMVWRCYRWYVKDRRQRKKRLKLLPDAGYVGELVVLKGGERLPEGSALPISMEGVLGSLRGDDVYLPVEGVAKKHLWYEYDEENGLRVEPFGGRHIEVDGEALIGRRKAAYMAHGSRLNVGGATLRLRMFAGFEQAGAQHAQERALEEERERREQQPQAAMQPTVPMLTPEQLLALQQMQHFQRMQWMAAWQAMQQYPQGANGMFNAQGMPVPMNGYPPQGNPMQGMPNGQAMQNIPMQAVPNGQGLPQNGTMQGYATPMQPTVRPAADGGEYDPPTLAPERGSIVSEEALDEPITRPERASRRRSRINPLPPVEETDERAYAAYEEQQTEPPDLDAGLFDAPVEDGVRDGNATFAPRVTFYPPVEDENGLSDDDHALPDKGDALAADDTWEYAPFPQSDVHFEDHGYTYPEYVDSPYEYADEDEAPKSLYVERDEAAKAKRAVWDKYLKGGRR